MKSKISAGGLDGAVTMEAGLLENETRGASHHYEHSPSGIEEKLDD
jgi:hypothetical protein